ncbi:hypothetical protein [Caldalkalibacillus mannanilyticus]|uniref:hypothetical protein n=1 Tax=Caldalkalibacillus mannanilyticus TaxID=1418 RepID=UPI0004681EF0|nr:hypothetical protein [Caldalkalibacillus mannanilyticus]
MKFIECDENKDFEATLDFFLLFLDDFQGTLDANAMEDALNLTYLHGKVYCALRQEKVIGMVGFTFGDPDDHYLDPSIAFIVYTLLLPDYRRSLDFVTGCRAFLDIFEASHITEVRFKAIYNHRYNNQLYSKFSRSTQQVLSSTGIPCNLYTIKMEDLKLKLGRYERRSKGSIYKKPE